MNRDCSHFNFKGLRRIWLRRSEYLKIYASVVLKILSMRALAPKTRENRNLWSIASGRARAHVFSRRLVNGRNVFANFAVAGLSRIIEQNYLIDRLKFVVMFVLKPGFGFPQNDCSLVMKWDIFFPPEPLICSRNKVAGTPTTVPG